MDFQYRIRKTLVASHSWRLAVLGIAVFGFAFSEFVTAQSTNSSTDERLQLPRLRTLDDYFPFAVPESAEAWGRRRGRLREDLLVSLGLWPLPERTALNPIVHGAIDRGDYLIEKVYFESFPGFFVTGNLYRPKNKPGPLPAVLCPHGHWRNGRFLWSTDEEIQRELTSGGEKLQSNARSVLQSRCASLARLGCLVFHYDMIGYADSQQISYDIAHGFKNRRPEMEVKDHWGLFSPGAEMRLQSVMGLQTWNSIRALDFLETLPEVDRTRIGVTGASGGGTQTFILGALDDRPAVAFPAVMVSTAMQGGCTCENCCNLRVLVGNVDFAGAFAPRPLGLTAANDWTVEMVTKGFPELQALYQLLGAPQNVQLTSRTEFGHNYNLISREAMYAWINQHLEIHAASTEEQAIEPLPPEQLTVFDASHPAPPGGPEFEVQLLRHWEADAKKQLAWESPQNEEQAEQLRRTLRIGFRGLLQLPPGNPEYLAESKTEQALGNLKHVAVETGWLKIPGLSFQTPTVTLSNPNAQPKMPARTIVLLDRNPGSQWMSLAQPNEMLMKSLEQGDRIVGLDLIYQGLLSDPAMPHGENRLVPNGRRAAAYTFGYNRSSLAQRSVQVVQLIRALRHSQIDSPIYLVSLNDTAPVVALAAANLDSDEIAGLAIELSEFDWDRITEFEDPRFQPGIVKYGGFAGCLSLDPGRPTLVVRNAGSPGMESAARSFALANGQTRWQEALAATPTETISAVLNWLR